MNMEPLLTIAIPTYNRPVQLRQTLEVVLKQIQGKSRVRLLVLDNHSEVPAAQILGELGVGLNEQVSIVRHTFNIGANANIMRSFELCETEWLWVLGDDDEPRSNAVQTILKDATGDHVFAAYSCPYAALAKPLPNGHLSGQTIAELFEAVDYLLPPMTMLSACVYRVASLRKRLTTGYCCMGSGLPGVAMAFAEIESGGKWLLSETTICDYKVPTGDQTWLHAAVLLGLPIAFLSLTHQKSLSGFRRCLQTAHHSSHAWLLLCCVDGFKSHRLFFSRQSGYFFRVMKAYYAPYIFTHPVDWVLWQAVSVASFFPRLFIFFVQRAFQLLGRPIPNLGSKERY